MDYFDEQMKDKGFVEIKKADLVIVWNSLHHRGYDIRISGPFFYFESWNKP